MSDHADSLWDRLPLAGLVCGIFSARTIELLHSRAGQAAVKIIRKLAAAAVAGLGIYFTVTAY
ncbi:MAG: hypothetical protein ABR605_01005 [Desulfurivibrionaceae bacterium]